MQELISQPLISWSGVTFINGYFYSLWCFCLNKILFSYNAFSYQIIPWSLKLQEIVVMLPRGRARNISVGWVIYLERDTYVYIDTCKIFLMLKTMFYESKVLKKNCYRDQIHFYSLVYLMSEHHMRQQESYGPEVNPPCFPTFIWAAKVSAYSMKHILVCSWQRTGRCETAKPNLDVTEISTADGAPP